MVANGKLTAGRPSIFQEEGGGETVAKKKKAKKGK